MVQHIEDNVAIRVINAHKSYNDGVPIINGLNMTVPIGKIYGLVGPSGCGKTTLLSSILGTQMLDSGIIEIQTKSALDIGYMPQDVCLDQYLTVHETLMFYGSLYRMSKLDIINNISELRNILELYFQNTYIKNLSGGQCRRVSLAVSLIHKPKIVILDEPTVGLDPILCDRIWNYFSNLVQDNKTTIIVTTHYIQEVHQADRVGFMRNGKIIQEAEPHSIMSRYNTDSLETAFLESVNETTAVQASRQLHSFTRTKSKDLFKRAKKIMSFHRVFTLFKKNCLIFSRDITYFFLVIILPIMLAIISNYSVGSSIEHINIAFLNEETNNSICKQFNFHGCIFDKDSKRLMSCEVLNYLRMLKYDLVELNSKKQVNSIVNDSSVHAFLYFPSNYTRLIQKDITNLTHFFSNQFKISHTSNQNYVSFHQINSHIDFALDHIKKNLISNCTINKKMTTTIETNIIYGVNIKARNQSIVGLLLVGTLFYFTSFCTASFMLSEKLNGGLIRTSITGVTIIEVMISFFIIQLISSVVYVALNLLLIFYLFDNSIESTESLINLCFILFLTVTFSFIFGLIVAGVSQSSLEVMFLTFSYSSGQEFFGGLMWPIEAQPKIMQFISKNTPVTLLGQISNDIVLKNWTLYNSHVASDFVKVFCLLLLHILFIYCLKYIKKDLWILRK
ncbi:ABC transporter G family member 23-like [Daktulosphaira vitifoliae]|uniref:ABC transporter G family member 23-like n=1 Tax=Daktulosphaira vitifoliae TaxID=58002 RepID=UPI0021A9F58B|nr:ABC transporter G family member 23-like [Daktulosphaira vitifoliae]XP_050519726.1 ABC transporter G family member 23-like [Daktulosphaira vitifoliae]